MNSFVWIRTKISQKKNCIQVGISTRDQYACNRCRLCHPPPHRLVSGHFIYIPYNKNTIQKMRLYKFIRATYSHPLFFISTYVSFVPVSDVLAIFVSDRRCEFSSKFWFVIRKKSFGGQVLGDPWSTETKHVLVNPKGFTKSCFIAAFLQCRWGCLYSIPLFKSICLTTTSTFAQHCLK